VREAGVPVSELTKTGGGTGESPQVIRERYEQQISTWVGRHTIYPPDARGREGRAVVRMRIDRTGYVRYYAIEQSSGIAAIDAAAIDMVRRANPMPSVPDNYPSGSLIEFLIPITFRAPR
jgi:protein TonB